MPASFNGYLSVLKATVTIALLDVFNDVDYPEADFAAGAVYVGIEYPIEAQQYPGIWIDYEDTKPLQRAGVDHQEITEHSGLFNKQTRWEYGGDVSFTCVALTSLERDRLYDELVRIFAFGPEDPVTANFRARIETNNLLAMNMDFDTLRSSGNAAAPGTPWGTDEIIYERSIRVACLGEFILDPTPGTLVPLSAINIIPTEHDDGVLPPAPDATEGLVTDYH